MWRLLWNLVGLGHVERACPERSRRETSQNRARPHLAGDQAEWLHLCAPVRLVRTEREFRLATGCGQEYGSFLAPIEPFPLHTMGELSHFFDEEIRVSVTAEGWRLRLASKCLNRPESTRNRTLRPHAYSGTLHRPASSIWLPAGSYAPDGARSPASIGLLNSSLLFSIYSRTFKTAQSAPLRHTAMLDLAGVTG